MVVAPITDVREALDLDVFGRLADGPKDALLSAVREIIPGITRLLTARAA